MQKYEPLNGKGDNMQGGEGNSCNISEDDITDFNENKKNKIQESENSYSDNRNYERGYIGSGGNKVFERLPELLSGMAVISMLKEAVLSPKPGLVDDINSGSHEDMDINHFVESSYSLKPYFEDLVKYCLKTYYEGRRIVISQYTEMRGKEAFREMMAATGNVNTHKGAIFTMGLMVLAVTEFMLRHSAVPDFKDREELKKIVSMNAVSYFSEVMPDSDDKQSDFNAESNGMKVRKMYGSETIVEEAEDGYPTLFGRGLDTFMHSLELGFDKKRCLLHVLISTMTVLSDSNVLKRGGTEGLKLVQNEARKIYENMENMSDEEFYGSLQKADQLFISHKLSPGGSADLLMALIFITDIFPSL